MRAPSSTLPHDGGTPASASEQQARQDATNASVAGATGVLALGNIASRVLGLAREMTLTYLFGATAAVSAFQVAIIVPRTIYDLMIGGHVNGAIVPVLGEIITVQGREALWRVVSILLSVVMVVLAVVVALLQFFAPQIVLLTAGGGDAAMLAQATFMLRLTAPALLLLGLFAVFSGTLIAKRNFVLPAFAGVVLNGGIVVSMLLLVPPLRLMPAPGPIFDPTMPVVLARPEGSITAAALGWVVGALLQLLLQLPGLRVGRLRLTIRWRHPALRRVLLLYAPVMLSLVMDTLVIRTFSYNLASQTGASSIAIMNFATTLIQFPQGLVATAISVAILPTLASQTAVGGSAALQHFRDTLGLGLRMATTLIIPAAFGLFLLATPLVMLVFEHGAFTPADTAITVLALRWYVLGLPFAAVDLLLVYAFYARKDTLTPALIGIFSHGVYMVTVLLLVDQAGLFSLMIADSVKHMVHASVSAFLLGRRLGGFGSQRFALTAIKTLLAASGMLIAGGALLPVLTAWVGTGSFLREALLVLSAAGVSGAIFLALALMLRIHEFYWLLGLVRRRLLRAP